MSKMIPYNKSMLKQLGVVRTSKGYMVNKDRLIDNIEKPAPDKTKLTDKKKFAEKETPEVKQLNREIKNTPKPKMTLADKERNERRGIY